MFPKAFDGKKTVTTALVLIALTVNQMFGWEINAQDFEHTKVILGGLLALFIRDSIAKKK